MKETARNMRAELAKVGVGRMFLHMACAMRDGRVQWHWEGIKRELPGWHEVARDHVKKDLEKN